MHPMYARTVIVRPRDHAPQLTRLGEIWTAVATAATTAARDVERAARHITINNDGRATAAFAAASSGQGSATDGLDSLADAAARTAGAHRAAAEATFHGVLAMDVVCVLAELQYQQALATPSVGKETAGQIVLDTRRRLLSLLDRTTDRLSDSYAGIDLPPRMANEIWVLADGSEQSVQIRDEHEGTIPPDLRDAWEALNPDEKQRVLANILAERSRADGLDTPAIVWETGDFMGQWRAESDAVVLNPDHLDNPLMLHAVVHEAQHHLQTEIAEDYRDLSLVEATAIDLGVVPDPFDQYESNIDEAERLTENPGPDDDYWYRPKERDARHAGRGFLDQLTDDKLASYNH